MVIFTSSTYKYSPPLFVETITNWDTYLKVLHHHVCLTGRQAFYGAVAGTEEENPQAHLMFFDTLCGTFKMKDVSPEFVLLRLLKFALNDDAQI